MNKIFIIVMFLAVSLTAVAQNGLHVASFFSEPYVSNPDVTMISMSGKQLAGKKINKYKSISVVGNILLADKIAVAVGKDGSCAISKEVSYKDGLLYFGFYSLGGENKNRRYLLFLNRRPSGKEKTTLIYIEGDLDAEAVKAMIK